MSYPLQPAEHYRLHFVRARYSSNVEEDLINLSSLLCETDNWRRESATRFFREKLRRRIPRLASKEDKTVDNFLTEVSSLFSLYEFEGDVAWAGNNAKYLANEQNIFEFFRHHLLRFQFPAGHVTNQVITEHVELGICFKPGRFFVELLLEGQRIIGKEHAFGITPAEATWFGTNDLAVLRGQRSPKEAAARILEARGNPDVDLSFPRNLGDYGLPQGIRTAPGDFVRYARDCLTMLEFAQVVTLSSNGRRYLKPNSFESVCTLVEDESWFGGYSEVNVGDLLPTERDRIRADWLKYANGWELAVSGDRSLLATHADTPPSLLAPASGEIVEPPGDQNWLDEEFSDSNLDANEIGSIGESIVVRHEVEKLRAAGFEDLASRVVKYPDHFAVGYDIKSWDEQGNVICIEVKTTATKNPVNVNRLHLTTNEWQVAETIGASYLIYRIELASSTGVRLRVLTDPVNRYKRGEIGMIPRDGADIAFDEDVVAEVEVLQ